MKAEVKKKTNWTCVIRLQMSESLIGDFFSEHALAWKVTREMRAIAIGNSGRFS